MWHVTLLPPDAILGYKCTQNAFADPAGGAYSAPPDPLAVFEVAASRQGRREERRERGGKGNGPSQLSEQIEAHAAHYC